MPRSGPKRRWSFHYLTRFYKVLRWSSRASNNGFPLPVTCNPDIQSDSSGSRCSSSKWCVNQLFRTKKEHAFRCECLPGPRTQTLPVGAEASTWFPDIMAGKHCIWIGVGWENPMDFKFRTSQVGTPPQFSFATFEHFREVQMKSKDSTSTCNQSLSFRFLSSHHYELLIPKITIHILKLLQVCFPNATPSDWGLLPICKYFSQASQALRLWDSRNFGALHQTMSLALACQGWRGFDACGEGQQPSHASVAWGLNNYTRTTRTLTSYGFIYIVHNLESRSIKPTQLYLDGFEGIEKAGMPACVKTCSRGQSGFILIIHDCNDT